MNRPVLKQTLKVDSLLKHSLLIAPYAQRTDFFFSLPYSISILSALLQCLPLIPVSQARSHIMFLLFCWNTWSPSTQETLHNLLQNIIFFFCMDGPLNTTTQNQIYCSICCATHTKSNPLYMVFGMGVLICLQKDYHLMKVRG